MLDDMPGFLNPDVSECCGYFMLGRRLIRWRGFAFRGGAISYREAATACKQFQLRSPDSWRAIALLDTRVPDA